MTGVQTCALPISGFRQIAVYIDTPGGPYFVKALGPAKTIAKWSPTITAFLASIAYK